MATVTNNYSVELYPTGYTGLTSLTTTTSYPVSNAYASSSNTSSYARFTLSSGSTGYIYYTFTTNIPSTATITSVACTARARVSSTSRVTSTQCQLYSGTTAKGSNSTFASTINTGTLVTLTTGTWTASELSDLRLKIGGTGSSVSGGGSSRYIYFYGATVTINYTVEETAYTITATVNQDATVDPASINVSEGESYTLIITPDDTTTAPTSVTDNGTDVTSSLVQENAGSSGQNSFTANAQTNSGLNSTSNATNPIGYTAESPNSSSSNIYSSDSGSTGYIDYTFDLSSIPSDATINSVSCTVNGHCESTSNSSETFTVQLYSGSTAKGSALSLTNSTSNYTASISDCGSWTRSELDSLKLRNTIGYYGGLLCGITLTIDWTVPGTGYIYKYTIPSVLTDHTIVVTYGSSGPNYNVYVKVNGNWVSGMLYCKSSGTWKEAEAIYAKDSTWKQ